MPIRFAIENGERTSPGTSRALSQPDPTPVSSPMVTSVSTETAPAMARLANRKRPSGQWAHHCGDGDHHQSTRQLHRSRSTGYDRRSAPPARQSQSKRTTGQSEHQYVVVRRTDAMRDQHRVGDHQPGREHRVHPARGRQPRYGPGDQHDPQYGEQAMRQHQHVRVHGESRDQTAVRERQWTVRRRRLHPHRVDGLDDVAGQHARAHVVRVEALGDEGTLRGVAPRVPAEQRRHQEQRRTPVRRHAQYWRP